MSDTLRYANNNIKLLLKYKNWTHKDLCKKTGITDITLSRKLNSKIPKWSMLEGLSIAKAFGLSVNDIFFTRMVPKCNTNNKEDEEAS